MHYRYLTLEQRGNLARTIAANGRGCEALLKRLRRPDYGVCITCHTDIPYVRLLAFPAALHCAACQSTS